MIRCTLMRADEIIYISPHLNQELSDKANAIQPRVSFSIPHPSIFDSPNFPPTCTFQWIPTYISKYIYMYIYIFIYINLWYIFLSWSFAWKNMESVYLSKVSDVFDLVPIFSSAPWENNIIPPILELRREVLEQTLRERPKQGRKSINGTALCQQFLEENSSSLWYIKFIKLPE